ncbi:MAG TPA: hypothetical protein PKY59_09105 [Pyrinomonadaceae bacterium]|nr:hypothetical protein [Pyrinomonadaceae bacterium]
MNDAFRRKMDKIDREEVFFNENGADFSSIAKVADLTVLINAEKAKILAFDAQQTSGFDNKRQAQEIYENRRDDLIDILEQYVLAAGIVDDDIEGTEEKFKMPRPRTDQNLIAKATSFAADALSIRGELIAAGLPAELLTEILVARDAFQQAALAHDAAEEKHAEGTGGMIDSFRKIMEYSRKRGKAVKLKYRANAAKLASWQVASHLDRAPKRSQNPPPTPPS